VTVSDERPGFSALFNRAAPACAEAQRLVGLSARTLSQSRRSRADALRLRRTVTQMREAWEEAEAAHSVLREEVVRVARTLREAGLDNRAAVATIRSRLRFVLYDDGLTEQDAEPVVARATLWVEQVYAAA
jgi:hypothetical protein